MYGPIQTITKPIGRWSGTGRLVIDQAEYTDRNNPIFDSSTCMIIRFPLITMASYLW